jgi:hypothetical protein
MAFLLFTCTTDTDVPIQWPQCSRFLQRLFHNFALNLQVYIRLCLAFNILEGI